MSFDGKYLIAGVGCAYREEYAAILVYDTAQWKLKQKLNFHFKGIQCLKISPNNKYMISIGSKEEKSVCVWNFTNLTVIDSKSVKFVPIGIKCEPQLDCFLYFTSIAQNVISFWRMDGNFKLEGFHVNINDLTREKEEGEFMVSIEITPYYNQIKTSFVIIGTNKGNILILDKEKKVLLRKYMISKFPITHLCFFNDSFICCGEGPIIHQWSFDPNSISTNNVFQFLEKEKSNLILLDSSITSVQLMNGKDGLCITDTGSIFFINFEEKAAFKIISSHINCPITSIECDLNNENILSCGGDGTVRCWTMDSFDQKFQLLKIEQKPEKCILNTQDNILIIHYDSSYLRLYNLTSLKSLGMLKIPDNNICNFELIFNNQAILLTTYQEKLFVIDIQNWDPLSVLFSELPFNPISNIIPKNQYCKSISTKNITSEKSYAVMSFSDGTVSTICIEKINGKIETSIVDRFNMIEYHMSKGDDAQIKEMYSNISNYRSDYKAQAKFSYQFDGVFLCYHEYLQFLYIRNYNRNEVIKSIPLNYFPYSLDLSEDEKYIAIGTKEGLVLFITRTDNTYVSGFNLDIFTGHYNHIDTIKFNKDASKVLSSSHSELLVWIIN